MSDEAERSLPAMREPVHQALCLFGIQNVWLCPEHRALYFEMMETKSQNGGGCNE